jgi:hypothetical protein
VVISDRDSPIGSLPALGDLDDRLAGHAGGLRTTRGRPVCEWQHGRDDVTADHFEHDVDLADIFEALGVSTNASTPKPSTRSPPAGRPVPITRAPTS